MPVFGPSNAQCRVFTYKEGILSSIAHDLEIDVTEFLLEASADSVRAEINASSLRVLHAMKDGSPIETLSDKDKAEIQRNIVRDVLDASQFPRITFSSAVVSRQASVVAITGVLSLHGIVKEVNVDVCTIGNNLVAELPIHQPDFGIKPYTAMLGTLKVKADLAVRVTVPVF